MVKLVHLKISFYEKKQHRGYQFLQQDLDLDLDLVDENGDMWSLRLLESAGLVN